MKCKAVSALLPLEAGKDLPETLSGMVAGHCASCARCGAELAAIRESMGPLASIGAARREAEARGPAAEVDHRLGAGASAAGKADPLGDAFWHAIRRDLRSEGLVRSPGEAAREGAPSGARILRAPVPGGGAVLRRAGMAAAAAILAGVFFLPGAFTRPSGEATPDAATLTRASTGASASVASAKAAGDAQAREAALAEERRWKARAAGKQGGLGGARAALVGGLGEGRLSEGRLSEGQVPGWIEETKSFTEPSIRFEHESWGKEGGDAPEDRGSLSF